MKTLNRVTIYEDKSDSDNAGWAYRHRRGDRDIESGPLEGVGDDCSPRQAWFEECVGYGDLPEITWKQLPEGVWVGEWEEGEPEEPS